MHYCYHTPIVLFSAAALAGALQAGELAPPSPDELDGTLTLSDNSSLDVDFGAVAVGTELHAAIQIRNDTSSAVTFATTKVSCGCITVDEVPQTLAPDAAHVIRVRIDTARKRGVFKQWCAVITDSPTVPMLRVDFSAALTGLWAVPAEVDLGPVSGDAVERVIALHSATDVRASVKDVVAVSEHGRVTAGVAVQRQHALDGESMHILATISIGLAPGGGALPGVLSDRVLVTVEFRDGHLEHLPILVSAFVVGRVRATPHRLHFGIVKGDARVTRQLRIGLPDSVEAIGVKVQTNHALIDTKIIDRNAASLTIEVGLIASRIRADTGSGRLHGTVIGTYGDEILFRVPVDAFVLRSVDGVRIAPHAG